MEIDVSGCGHCIFRHDDWNLIESWCRLVGSSKGKLRSYLGVTRGEDGYPDVELDQDIPLPKFCPLRDGPVVVGLR